MHPSNFLHVSSIFHTGSPKTLKIYKFLQTGDFSPKGPLKPKMEESASHHCKQYVVFAQLRGKISKNCSFEAWIWFLVVEIRHFRKFDKYLHFWCHEGAVRMPPLALSKFLGLVHENNVRRYRNNAYFKFSSYANDISHRCSKRIAKLQIVAKGSV